MKFPPKASRYARVTLSAATLFLCTLPSSAQNSLTTETGSITSPPSLPAGAVVLDMDVSGNTMVFSALSTGAGLVVPPYVETHVFLNGEWIFENRIEHPSPSAISSLNRFGNSVSIDGDQLIIGGNGEQSAGVLRLSTSGSAGCGL